MPKKAPKNNEDNKKDQVFDVSKPGKAEAQATGRPIIVTRKPIVQDPMVREGSDVNDVPGPPALTEKETRFRSLKRSSRINITPEGELNNEPNEEEAPVAPKEIKPEDTEAKPDETNEKPVTDETEEKSPEESSEEQKEDKPANSSLPASVKEVIEPDAIDNTPPVEAKPEKIIKPDVTDEDAAADSEQKEGKPEDTEESAQKPKEDDDKDSEAPSEAKDDEKSEDGDEEPSSQAVETSGIVDELAKQAANKKSKEKEEKEIEVKHQKTEKLVAEKTYFLPIGEVTRRKKNRNAGVVLLLVLLLALIGANFAMDAGVIDAPDPIKPLTDLIPN